MRYHPWRHARDLDIAIEFVPNLRARATYSAGLIQIRAGLSQRERRAAVAHEIVHYERGDDGVACSRWHLQKLERQVHLEAARRLITIEDLADAVIGEPDYPCMAQKLWVDDYTFRLRLAYVSDEEREQIQHLCPSEWRIA
ncbi:ImmA/IrrE family metallo-endopeptidase [Gordonia soli]|nr:ImmA/IrrE family metallo-endopeptidase [Gordonia soli]